MVFISIVSYTVHTRCRCLNLNLCLLVYKHECQHYNSLPKSLLFHQSKKGALREIGEGTLGEIGEGRRLEGSEKGRLERLVAYL